MHLQEARLAFTLSCNTSSADSGRKMTTDAWPKYLLDSAKSETLRRSAKQQ